MIYWVLRSCRLNDLTSHILIDTSLICRDGESKFHRNLLELNILTAGIFPREVNGHSLVKDVAILTSLLEGYNDGTTAIGQAICSHTRASFFYSRYLSIKNHR